MFNISNNFLSENKKTLCHSYNYIIISKENKSIQKLF